MNIVDTKTLSIKEAIELCIKKGLSGTEAQLASFIKNKKLATNQKVKLHGNLERLFHNVLITGGGKSGKCILTGEKENITKRINGNSANGKKLTDNDEIMKEYLFQLLCNKGEIRKEIRKDAIHVNTKIKLKRDYTNNQLIELFNVLPTATNQDSSSIYKELKKLFQSYYSDELITYMQKNITNNLDSRKRDDIKLFIKHLEFEGRIEVSNLYYGKYLGDSEKIEEIRKEENLRASFEYRQPELISSFQRINELEFNELQECIKEIINEHGFTYQEYIQASKNLIKVDLSMKAMLEEIKEYLAECQLDFIYKSLDIAILKPETKMEIKHEQANKAFENKVILLTNKRMETEKYSSKTSYQKEFYRLCMFITLRKLKVNGLDDAILKEIARIGSTVNELASEYGKNKMEQEERTIIGFGVDSAGLKKMEVPAAITNEEVAQIFEDRKQQKAEEVKEIKPAATLNDEIDWMDHILAMKKEKRKEILPAQFKSLINKPILTGNMIDIGAIADEPEPVKVKKQYNRIFGSSFVIRNDVTMEEWAANE